MKNEVLIGDVKFWKDQNIVHCKFYNPEVDIEFVRKSMDEYLSVISFLSNGVSLPLLINLKEVDGLFSYKIFKLFGMHPKIKDVYQYKAFLINSNKINFLFSIYNFFSDPIFPNKVFTNPNEAINYCEENNYSFNVIN
jgi:hypothetical protein